VGVAPRFTSPWADVGVGGSRVEVEVGVTVGDADEVHATNHATTTRTSIVRRFIFIPTVSLINDMITGKQMWRNGHLIFHPAQGTLCAYRKTSPNLNVSDRLWPYDTPK
jgi:hypothetical protein